MKAKTAKAQNTDSEARHRILETAKRLFYAQGYLATGINQVIAESNVAKNTFYYYFPSKEDLCIAYLEARHEAWGGALREKVMSFKSPLKRVLGIFDYLEDWLTDCRYRGCAFLNISSEVPDTEHRIRKKVTETKAGLHQEIDKLVRALKESDKKYRHLNVSEVSKVIYVLFEGAIVSVQSLGETWPIRAAKKNAKALLENSN